MFQNTITTPCIYACSCPDMHEKGIGYAELTWLASDPLAVSVTALGTSGKPLITPQGSPTFTIARDVLHTATRSGRKFGFPVVGGGDVTCKVLSFNVTTLSLRWKPGYVMLVDRDIVSRWIDESYTIVPVTSEDEIVNMDAIIEKILKGDVK